MQIQLNNKHLYYGSKSSQFLGLTQNDISKISVCEINNDQVYDNLNVPITGGLHDPRMGPIGSYEQCKTCNQRQLWCQGHLGHINLKRYMFNPLYFLQMLKLLKHICTKCHKLIMSESRKKLAYYKLMLLQYNYVVEAQKLNNLSDESVRETEILITLARRKHNSQPCVMSQTAAQLRDQVIKDLMQGGEKCVNCKEKRSSYKRFKNLKVMQNADSIYDKRQKIKEDVSNTSNKHETNANIDNSDDEETDQEFQRIIETDETDERQFISTQFVITADTVHDFFMRAWEMDGYILTQIFGHVDIFFIQKLIVIPSRMRPAQFLGKVEALHPVTIHLQKIIRANNQLNEDMEDVNFIQSLVDLQQLINDYLDSGQTQNAIIKGIKQTLEHKEGLIRSNIQGKRVNYAARSVISPDLCLDTSEVGIPDVFAKTLSFAEPCTHLNRDLLCKLVENGPNYPGAISVRFPGQRAIDLKATTQQERNSLAKRLWQEAGGSGLNIVVSGALPVVERHVMNGDPMIFNRQPTLHRNSMLIHKARVVAGHGRSIRFHYANCAGYNSDFDGDEMNLHYTRTYDERAEALELCLNDKHYVTMTAGKPVRGLFQDSVIGAVKLCSLDTFLTHESFSQLLWNGICSIMKNQREKLGLRTLEEKIIEARNINKITSASPMYAGNAIKLAGFLDIQRGNGDGFALEARKVAGMFENAQNKTECATDVSEFVNHTEDEQKHKQKDLKVQILQETTDTTAEQLQPAILFPKVLYTGKQVVSGLIKSLPGGKDITMQGGTAMPRHFWGVHSDQEGTLKVVGGEVMCGLIDKKHIASQPRSLAHIIAELYGPEMAGVFLSAFARLAQAVLQKHGISCSLEDLILQETAQKQRHNILNRINEDSENILKSFLKLDQNVKVTDQNIRQAIQREINTEKINSELLDRLFQAKSAEIASQIGEKCGPAALVLPQRNNGLAMMVVSGAKGSGVNLQMMTSVLGQQSLEGRRVPTTAAGRTLPCHRAYALGLKEGGFIPERYVGGLGPQSFFFHHQAGREGLVDTAVKTATSGYFQRCVMKCLEGLAVAYDGSVRDGAGALVQTKAGGDGVSPLSQELLLDFQLVKNCINAFLQRYGNVFHMQDQQKSIERLIKASKDINVTEIKQNDYQLRGSEQQRLRKILHYARSFRPTQFGSADIKDQDTVIQLIDLIKSIQKSQDNEAYLLAEITGGKRFYDALNEFIQSANFNSDTEAKLFREICLRRLLDSQYCPGEAIGVIAAQSIGEPSTQLTLNTFHLAGHGAANVTLGIPRLKELVQTAKKKISTPLMTIQVTSEDAGKQLMELLQPQSLQELLEKLRLTQELQGGRKILGLDLVFRPETHESKDGYFSQLSHNKLQKLTSGVTDAMQTLKKLLLKQLKRLDEQHSVISESDKTNELVGVKRTEKVRDNDDEDDVESSDDANVSYDEESGPQQKNTDEQNPEEYSSYYSETDNEYSQTNQKVTIKDLESTIKGNVERLTCSDIAFRDVKCTESTIHIEISIDGRHNLLYLTFIEQAVSVAHCNSIDGISKCYLRKEQNGNIFLDVNGCNVSVMKHLSHELARTNEIKCNHIYAMLETFGVEAARAVLINEISIVFSKYSIAVDERHLGLLADYMTFLGGIRPCSRTGIKHIGSQFQKSSFETACVFLTQAAQASAVDDLSSPSSAVTMGAYCRNQGTGCFQLLQEIQI